MNEQLVEPQARVGDDLVEVVHQVGLRGRLDLAQLDAAGWDPLAPEGRVRGGMAAQLLQLLLAEALEPLVRPVLTLEQLLASTLGLCEVLKSLDSVAHLAILHRSSARPCARPGPGPPRRAA